jgi:hypothetical protein
MQDSQFLRFFDLKEASQKRKWSIGPASSGMELFIQERFFHIHFYLCLYTQLRCFSVSEDFLRVKIIFQCLCLLYSCVGENFAGEEHGDLQDINVRSASSS